MGIPLAPPPPEDPGADGGWEMNEVMLFKDLALLSGNAMLNYKKDVSRGWEFISFFLFFFNKRFWEQSKRELAGIALTAWEMFI